MMGTDDEEEDEEESSEPSRKKKEAVTDAAGLRLPAGVTQDMLTAAIKQSPARKVTKATALS